MRKLSDDEVVEMIESMRFSCVLDAVEEGGELTLNEVAGLVGLTRERVRQVQKDALWNAAQGARFLAGGILDTLRAIDVEVQPRHHLDIDPDDDDDGLFTENFYEQVRAAPEPWSS